jgi:two-component system, NarL family, invasion response regulator UvrY
MIRIFLADDHTIFRQGLRQILADEADIDIVGEATDGDELLAQLPLAPCDIVLLDLTMPGRSGISLLREIAAAEDRRVVVLSMHEEDQYIVEALKAGAAGLSPRTAPRISCSRQSARSSKVNCSSAPRHRKA